MQEGLNWVSSFNECCQTLHDTLCPLLESDNLNHQTLLRCLILLLEENNGDDFGEEIKSLIVEATDKIFKESSVFSAKLKELWSPRVFQLLAGSDSATISEEKKAGVEGAADNRSSPSGEVSAMPRTRSFERIVDCLSDPATFPRQAVMPQNNQESETISPRERGLPKRLSAVMSFESPPGSRAPSPREVLHSPVPGSPLRTIKPESPREAVLSPTQGNSSKARQTLFAESKQSPLGLSRSSAIPVKQLPLRRSSVPVKTNSFWNRDDSESSGTPEPSGTKVKSKSLE
jgi:hypothetical protein